MEQPDYIRSAERPSDNREIDYCALMRLLSAGDISSARLLCTSKPDLTKLLVKCGRLTGEELTDLLLVHETDGLNELPLGTFFVYAGCLTIEELRAFLALQKDLRPGPQRQEKWGQKLVKSGLLSADELQTALSDRIAGNITLRQAILNRGYLGEAELDKIF